MRISDWSSDVCSSDLALSDDHARTRSGQALPRVRRTLWRPDRAGGDARVDEAFRAISGVEGLDLFPDRQSRLGEPRPRSEEHTSELQSLMRLSYAVFCLKTKIHHHSLYYMYNSQHDSTAMN